MDKAAFCFLYGFSVFIFCVKLSVAIAGVQFGEKGTGRSLRSKKTRRWYMMLSQREKI